MSRKRAAWRLKQELDAEVTLDGDSVIRHVYVVAGDHPSMNDGPPRLVALPPCAPWPTPIR